jgi:hypothetical protein
MFHGYSSQWLFDSDEARIEIGYSSPVDVEVPFILAGDEIHSEDTPHSRLEVLLPD